MKLRSLLRAWLVCAGLFLPFSAYAEMGLEQARYALYKDPAARVTQDLRALSERGDLTAKILLANILADTSIKEAVGLYKEAFADGLGKVSALIPLGRLLDSSPYLRERNADYIRRALRQYPHEQDLMSVTATLEIFATYPDFIPLDEAHRLIDLYETACLFYCRPQFYRAVLAEREGQTQRADAWYRQAIWMDARAVTRYYDFMGEAQDEKFPEFTRAIAAHKSLLPVEVVHHIATLLETIFSTRAGIIADAHRRQREAEKGLTGEAKEKARAAQAIRNEEDDRLLRETQTEILTWLDNAVERGWVPAMSSKINQMIAMPTEDNSGEAIMRLVKRIEQSEPQTAKAMRAQLYQALNWRTLAPYKAYELIQELMADDYPGAELLLARLYSRGGLDEGDQARALDILHKHGLAGSGDAFFLIANIYRFGRSVCHDKMEAYAHADVARQLGSFRARGLVKRLERDMGDDELRQARQHSVEVLAGEILE